MFSSEKEMKDALDKAVREDPVPCNGCTACCRGNQTVLLLPEHDDDPERYPAPTLTTGFYGGRWGVQLKCQSNGDCIFLRKGICAVYDRRPSVCRNFDCRRVVYGSTKEQRDAAIEHGVFSKEIIEAGLQRSMTLKLAPWEKIAYAPGNGYQEFVLGGPNKRLG